ncbi:MAG: class I SAM-dependent methyltransferase [Polyangiaceae bacterium]
MSRFFAALYDPFMRKTEDACLGEWRRALLAEARGDVLEVGAGTGINLPFYPAGLGSLTASEPDIHMRKKAEARAHALGKDICFVAAPVEALPFPDESFDVVVATLLLCSVPSPELALASIRRVLKPNGLFLFLEHVAAEDNPGRLVWQKRIEPVWSVLAEGCRLTCHTLDTIRAAGFLVDDPKRESMRKAMPFLRPTVRGVAKKALA